MESSLFRVANLSTVFNCRVWWSGLRGEKPGDGGVERLDDDRYVPRDRGRKRDEPVGRDPEGIDEVGDQQDPDDDVHQEVGDVCREVARELGGEASLSLFRSGVGVRHGINVFNLPVRAVPVSGKDDSLSYRCVIVL